MPIGELCNREVVFARRTTTIVEAAQLMRRYHVGDLVVVDEVGGRRIPVGMLTDRDIVVEIIAKSLPVEGVTAGELMRPRLVSVPETAGVVATIQLMRAHGVRRIPVVDPEGGLAGIVSVDDLLDLLAEELTELAKVAPRGQASETRTRGD
ncbi:CBS domain containing protein [Desulfobulbus propionicus DSM 2032]|jgi:CBS domain-containing protein|uniref:CBS domain containing protein n=1 Tax=Desulfobulbus propionicus (strain ATCC 33891 / DSM 2032 / VKM B-1956 / 1pr3) TaxID=577650 RepID=A0A7U3YLA3_DESPD|nr:CBS domain-containing protein [Desulfobulbus propionicus]ADW17464.1 CBS domain containing protein [Desulfobulbus propionicus DSM 2032]